MGGILLSNIARAKERWNKQKSMGKKRFILVYGVLLWGVCISIIYGTITIFFNPNPINYNILGILFRYIAYSIIFGLGGILFSIGLWHINLNKFDNK